MLHRFVLSMVLITSLLSTSSYAADDTYLCVAEESTGFYFRDGKWGRAKFDVSEEKSIIRKIKKDDPSYITGRDGHTHTVVDLGEKYPSGPCKGGEPMSCDLLGGNMFISIESGRFIRTYTSGYWDGVDNNDNTPNITRGRCSKI